MEQTLPAQAGTSSYFKYCALTVFQNLRLGKTSKLWYLIDATPLRYVATKGSPVLENKSLKTLKICFKILNSQREIEASSLHNIMSFAGVGVSNLLL